jgi:hypothetical protein
MNGFAISKEFGESNGVTVLFVLEKTACSKSCRANQGQNICCQN